MNNPEIPQWWKTLTSDDSAERLGVNWRDPADWEPPDESASGGTLRNPTTMELDASIREGKLLVGTGPSVNMRGMGLDVDVHWYLDPGQPDQLWCALGFFYDPRLWIPVEPEPAALAEVLSASHPKPALNTVTLTSFTRGFLGFRDEVMLPNVYDGQLVPFNGLDLDRYTTMISYLEHSSWASSHQEDPLHDDFEAVSPLAMSAFDRERNTKSQLLGRVPSMTWRTLHSRSHLSFEVHSRNVVCVGVRYRPSPVSHHAVVKRINEAFKMGYPLDLPLDVVGALTCFDFLTEDDLEHHLTEPESTGHLASAIRVHAALWHGNLRRSLRLREFAAHPEPSVRNAVLRVAADYNYRFLFEEAALVAASDEPAERLEHFLIVGGDPDNYNAFGDSFAGQQPIMVDKEGNPVNVHTDFIGDSDVDEEDEAS
ncbi:hypothetical protein [Stackebrandtia nassauensis]|uniref:Uncharacterized protein n=1 Tax=Stackebrandtia nassauensis (strain DSM 44728 / CIP 108903 / NRRL B-16338 / NBRC 102104 / LLR-40K-21) TaxID=446470 RepID=D3Q3Q8_STANL|nr:hypothetical protein [Stackebrandtia nassauensis]ADD43975.1 hypothetical protein Snas_4328 [Stackebrandtia nassauensis DSM 44728]